LPVTGLSGAASPGRLRKRAEFLAVRQGQKRRGPFFLLEVLDRKDDGPARFGLTVTKKCGNAVARNRIRRRLREAIRVLARDETAPGSDYVVVGRPDVLAAPFGQLAGELVRRMRVHRPGTQA